MPKSLKETIIRLKNARDNKRIAAAKLRSQADALENECAGLTEALDALEPWSSLGMTPDPALPGNGFGGVGDLTHES